MERQYISLGERAFIWINGPVNFISFTVNIFYAYCLIFPSRSRRRLKQPLKTLLEFLVFCSVSYCVSLPFLCYVVKVNKGPVVLIISSVIVEYFMHNSMTSYVWLNFYYCIYIVPAQRGLAIWVKRNIRPVIYAALLYDGMLFLFGTTLNVAKVFQISSGLHYINNTWTEAGQGIDALSMSRQVFFFIVRAHILICLCIMMVSSFSTARYLHRHMRSLAQSGVSFSTPRLHKEMRVTITGIFQGLLYFLYNMFILLDSFSYMLTPHFYFSVWVSLTATSLYIFGTTVNLGVGQAIFRQRAANVWMALKAPCGVGMVTHGGKSDEIVNAVTVDVQMSL